MRVAELDVERERKRLLAGGLQRLHSGQLAVDGYGLVVELAFHREPFQSRSVVIHQIEMEARPPAVSPRLHIGRENDPLAIGMKDQFLYQTRHAVFSTFQLRQISAFGHHANAPVAPHFDLVVIPHHLPLKRKVLARAGRGKQGRHGHAAALTTR